MTLHATDAPDHPHGSPARRIGLVALTGFLAAVALKWAWSKTAVALFALPDASFAQAASVVIALIATLALGRLVLGAGASLPRP